jgi:hypothetical protein
MATVRPGPVRPVFLGVVLLHPPVVSGDELFPAFGFGEVVVRHPPLDIEGRFDEILPGSSLLGHLFGDA